MLEYLAILASFITGGGISTLITLRYIRKVGKIDYTEKAIAFIEKQYDDVLTKNKELHERVTALEKLIPLVCFKMDCTQRQKLLEDQQRDRKSVV
jgi:hypothetical protein